MAAVTRQRVVGEWHHPGLPYIAIRDGLFTITTTTDRFTCPARVRDMAHAFVLAGTPEHVQCSSSIDFPRDSGLNLSCAELDRRITKALQRARAQRGEGR